jgi:hypothetical protein
LPRNGTLKPSRVSREIGKFCKMLTHKTRIHLRSTSVRTYTFCTTGIP